MGKLFFIFGIKKGFQLWPKIQRQQKIDKFDYLKILI